MHTYIVNCIYIIMHVTTEYHADNDQRCLQLMEIITITKEGLDDDAKDA